MYKFFLLSVLLLGLTMEGFSQSKVGDVSVPESVDINGTSLVLNGAGIRSKFFMDMYVGALFLKEKNNNANSIISSDEPMSIRLYITSGMITSQRMTDAITEGFENATGGKTTPLMDKINQFTAVFNEKIVVGDKFEFNATKGSKVQVIKNGKQLTIIEGKDFKEALFGIWFCDTPADKNLKEKMLGKS
ncbi:chalcone isomerase family protein [Limibacter armeniacum]|uniref:chalcone isomerase family protein n=1 Tax=Limibacter armeniacum TaxID=466084 RepID=UPI002FE51FE8